MLRLNHLSLITASLDKVREKLGAQDVPIGTVESFPNEGTREFYAGDPKQSCRLLVQEPLEKHGSYRRALDKFGPGIHHLALSVPDPRQYVEKLQGSGWYVLPGSLKTVDNLLWLGRPGLRFLVEIVRGPYDQNESFISNIQVPCTEPKLLTNLAIAAGAKHLHDVEPILPTDDLKLTIAGFRWNLKDLLE